jgi:hypothetical protein
MVIALSVFTFIVVNSVHTYTEERKTFRSDIASGAIPTVKKFVTSTGRHCLIIRDPDTGKFKQEYVDVDLYYTVKITPDNRIKDEEDGL